MLPDKGCTAAPAVEQYADTASAHVLAAQPPALQGYQQYPQTAPRVEEVPHEAAGSMNAGQSRSGQAIVEEPGMHRHPFTKLQLL